MFPTLGHVWVAACLLGPFALLSWRQIAPNDFWWHVRVGEVIAVQRSIPTTDIFSFTQAGQPWTYQSWLAEVVFYGLLALGGPPLVIFVHAAVITSAFAILLAIARHYTDGDLRLAALATFAAALLSASNWSIRPQAFSFLFFALTLYLIERYRWQGGRSLWLLPPLMALWANVHGGFVFGLLLLALFALSRLAETARSRSSQPMKFLAAEMTAVGLAFLAVLANPAGPGIVRYVLRFWRHDITRLLNTEFQPAVIRTAVGAPFFAIAFLLLLLLLHARYQPPLEEGLRLLAFGLLALLAVRSIVWFGLAMVPTLAVGLRRWRGQEPARAGNMRLNRALLAVLILAALLSLSWLRPYLPMMGHARDYLTVQTPVQATEVLCQATEGPKRVFADLTYASYVEWACPAARVFVDTRMEQYPTEQWLEYLAVNDGRYDWQRILERYGVTHLLLNREQQVFLLAAASESPAWQVMYQDDYTVLLARRAGT